MSFFVPVNSRITGAGTDTITADDLQGGSVGYAVTCTVTVPQNVPEGRSVTLYATADGVVITISVGGADTISGSPVTLNTNQAIRLSKTTSTAWRLLQSGSVATRRVVAQVSSGAWTGTGYVSVNGAWIAVTGAVAPTSSGDPEGWGFSLSGSDILVTTGAGVINAATRTEAPYWAWSLADFSTALASGPYIGAIDVSVSSVTLTAPAAGDWNGVGGCFSTGSNLTTGALYCCGIGRSSTSYARLAEDETAVPTAFAVSTTMRRGQFSHLLPLQANAEPFTYFFNGSNVIESASGSPACASSGTPTHFGVQLLKLGTPRNGTIAAPQVIFYF